MSKVYKYRAECLVCGHEESITRNSKEECKEVDVCPKCKGAFVDIWHKRKYDKPISTPTQIQFNSATEPPVVLLDGRELNAIIDIQYNYATRTASSPGKHEYLITYFDNETNMIKTIGDKRWY